MATPNTQPVNIPQGGLTNAQQQALFNEVQRLSAQVQAMNNINVQATFDQNNLQALATAITTPAAQPQFDPGINPVLTTFDNQGNPIGVPVYFEHHELGTNQKDMKGVKAPDPFTGSQTDARPFLDRVTAWFFLCPVKFRMTRDRIVATCQLMTSNSRSRMWAHSVMKAISQGLQNPYYTDNWTEFHVRFLENYGIANEKEWAIHQLKIVRQGKDSLESYITKFGDLIGLSGFTDEAVLYDFQRGLDPDLYKAVSGKDVPPTDLKGWMSEAKKKDLQRQNQLAFLKNNSGHQVPNKTFFNFRPVQPSPRPARISEDAMDVDAVYQRRAQVNTRQPQRPQGRPQQQRPRPQGGIQRADPPKPSFPPYRPQQQQQAAPQRAQVPQPRCFKCGRIGHIARNCETQVNELSHEERDQLLINLLMEREIDQEQGEEQVNVLETEQSVGDFEEVPEQTESILDEENETIDAPLLDLN
jgi:hypothetical protein